LHLANGKLYFELLEILSAAQNDLPFQGEKAPPKLVLLKNDLWSK
jgi:Txe/YoeB family toxin of Txe-Axe toxin-antitoxin module